MHERMILGVVHIPRLLSMHRGDVGGRRVTPVPIIRTPKHMRMSSMVGVTMVVCPDSRTDAEAVEKWSVDAVCSRLCRVLFRNREIISRVFQL